jgi:hypothetical protein
LAKLLDKDTETYGKRGDHIRDQLQKKVQTWVKWSQDRKYVDKVLNQFRVQASKYHKKEDAINSASEESDNQSVTSLITSDGDIEPPKKEPTKRATKNSKKQDQPPPPTVIESKLAVTMSKDMCDGSSTKPKKVSKFNFFCFFLMQQIAVRQL